MLIQIMKNSEKFKKKIQELRENLELEISENIQNLQSLISNENPFKLLIYSENPQRIEQNSFINLILS